MGSKHQEGNPREVRISTPVLNVTPERNPRVFQSEMGRREGTPNGEYKGEGGMGTVWIENIEPSNRDICESPMQ